MSAASGMFAKRVVLDLDHAGGAIGDGGLESKALGEALLQIPM